MFPETKEIVDLIRKEIDSPVKRKFFENGLYAIAIIASILTVFLLGKLDYSTLFNDTNHWLAKGGGFALAVLILSFVWYVIMHFMARDVAEKKHARFLYENAERTLEWGKEFCCWGNDWKSKADGILGALEIEYFRKRGLLMDPKEYTEFIQKQNKIHFVDQNKGHCRKIRFCGSMVGFSFLLPNAIRDHACEAKNDFKKIEILSTDIKYNGEEQDVFWYTTYLISQTIEKLGITDEQSDFVCKNYQQYLKDNDHTFIIEIRYVDHDLLAALCDVHGASLAVLQSLDVNNFIEILESTGSVEKDKRYQLGFRFDDKPGEKDEYTRYTNAFDNIWKLYKNRSEIWMLSHVAKSIRLRIFNPRWYCSDESQCRIFKPYTNEEFENNSVQFNNNVLEHEESYLIKHADQAKYTFENLGIEKFLHNLLADIPRQNTDIDRINKVFARIENIGKLRNTPCVCNRNNQ